MELAELLRIQDALDLHHTHLIFFAGDGFVIAHTVVERAREEVRSARPARRGSPRPDLERCRLHAWASELDLEARWSGSGLWRLGYGSPTTPWPNLVALDILSRSPHPRPKIAMRTEVVAAYGDVRVTRDRAARSFGGHPSPPSTTASIVRDYNAMVDELEILSAALVAKGADPKRILGAWRGAS